MSNWIIAACACALGLMLGALLALRVQKLRQRRLAQARQVRGKRGEDRAAALLDQHGYRVIDRQRRIAYAVQVGDVERAVELVLDFVVVRDGEELVAEVKTGSTAVQLKHADTRRQLLEYQLATGCSRVLLVDPERAAISEVRFPITAQLTCDVEGAHSAKLTHVALLILVCAAAGWVLLRAL